MGVSIEWVDLGFNCPHCGQKIIASFCDDYDSKRVPERLVELAGGKAVCNYCKTEITDEDLKEVVHFTDETLR